MDASSRAPAPRARERGSRVPEASAPFQPPAGLPSAAMAGPRESTAALPWERPSARAVESSLGAMRGPAGPGAAGAGSAGPGSSGGGARARIREMPRELEADAQYQAQYGAAPVEAQAPVSQVPRQPWYQVVTGPLPAKRAGKQVATRAAGLSKAQAAPQAKPKQEPVHVRLMPALVAARTRLPYVAAHPVDHPPTADGRVHCGPLERILHRQWNEGAPPPVQVIAAINRLAELPRHLQQKLADGLTGIFVGPGGVPDLDDMGALKGVPLPSGRATWDACAGAYGERKLVVGSRLSPTPDVMCHEVGHALDDLDSPAGTWQSDSAEFKTVYDQCKPHLVSDFHRQRGGLGRKEFFADAFAAIASGQRPALVDMLGGDTRNALWVMLYFNRRYGI